MDDLWNAFNADDDEDSLWAQSIAKTMAKLPEATKALFKLKVQTLITELQFPGVVPQAMSHQYAVDRQSGSGYAQFPQTLPGGQSMRCINTVMIMP